jgi:collagen beta-1,O-galactosyltransferase
MTVRFSDIPIYVINLRRRSDRRAWIQRQIGRHKAIYTSDWDGPFDGLDLTRAQMEAAGYGLFDWQITSDNPWWSRPLKYGEIGCTLSHLAVWDHAAVHARAPYVLVLEDDAVLEPGFGDRLEAIVRRAEQSGGFDLLYLGRFPLEPDRPIAEGLVVPGYSHCTFAYLLNARSLPTLLAAGLQQAIVPIDEFLPAMYTEHARDDLRLRFPPRLSALACHPPLVTQLPKALAGSDTEDSPFVGDVPPTIH